METQEADGERVVSEFVVVTPLQDRTLLVLDQMNAAEHAPRRTCRGGRLGRVNRLELIPRPE